MIIFGKKFELTQNFDTWILLCFQRLFMLFSRFKSAHNSVSLDITLSLGNFEIITNARIIKLWVAFVNKLVDVVSFFVMLRFQIFYFSSFWRLDHKFSIIVVHSLWVEVNPHFWGVSINRRFKPLKNFLSLLIELVLNREIFI